MPVKRSTHHATDCGACPHDWLLGAALLILYPCAGHPIHRAVLPPLLEPSATDLPHVHKKKRAVRKIAIIDAPHAAPATRRTRHQHRHCIRANTWYSDRTTCRMTATNTAMPQQQMIENACHGSIGVHQSAGTAAGSIMAETPANQMPRNKMSLSPRLLWAERKLPVAMRRMPHTHNGPSLSVSGAAPTKRPLGRRAPRQRPTPLQHPSRTAGGGGAGGRGGKSRVSARNSQLSMTKS